MKKKRIGGKLFGIEKHTFSIKTNKKALKHKVFVAEIYFKLTFL